jgi:hypothetical protein
MFGYFDFEGQSLRRSVQGQARIGEALKSGTAKSRHSPDGLCAPREAVNSGHKNGAKLLSRAVPFLPETCPAGYLSVF